MRHANCAATRRMVGDGITSDGHSFHFAASPEQDATMSDTVESSAASDPPTHGILPRTCIRVGENICPELGGQPLEAVRRSS